MVNKAERAKEVDLLCASFWICFVHEIVDRGLEIVDLLGHFIDPPKDLLSHVSELGLHLGEYLIHEIGQVFRLRRNLVRHFSMIDKRTPIG
jgi:hypothetical protein